MNDFLNQVLYSDPFKYNIINFLTAQDLYYLNQVNKQFNNLVSINFIKQHIIREINHRLQNILKDEFNDFKKYFQRSKCIISGSFIMQCVLGEHWYTQIFNEDISDIDIYIPFCDIVTNNFTTKYHNSDLNEENFTVIEDYLAKNYYNSYYPHYLSYNDENISVDINNIYGFYPCNSYKNTLQTIQILLENTTFKEYMHKKFDINACKSMYYIDDSGVEQLYIPYMVDIVTKLTNVNIKEFNLDRCCKYTDRGFKFKNIMNLPYNEIYNFKKYNMDDNIKIIKMKKLEELNENKTIYQIKNKEHINYLQQELSLGTMGSQVYHLNNCAQWDEHHNNLSFINKNNDLVLHKDNCDNCKVCFLKLLSNVPYHIHFNFCRSNIDVDILLIKKVEK